MLSAEGLEFLEPEPDVVCVETFGKALRVVQVFEEPAMLDWTRVLWVEVARAFGERSAQLKSWLISDLASPALYEQAVVETADSDLILISVRAASELPVPLYAWVDAWLPRRLGRAGSLVVLLGGEQPGEGRTSHAFHYLQAVARRAGMEFLPRHRQWLRDTRAPQSAVQVNTGMVESHWHWGINE